MANCIASEVLNQVSAIRLAPQTFPFEIVERYENMLKRHYLFLLIWVFIFFNKSLNAIQNNIPNTDEIIENISKYEYGIQNISAKINVTIPETNDKFVEGEWGYSQGREYIKGTINLYLDYVDKKVEHPFQDTFDGEIMSIYRHDPLINNSTGRITTFESASFVGFPTLNTLLGHDVHSSGRLSMAEALKQAESVNINPKMSDINGHKCYVVEAIRIQKPVYSGDIPIDVRLWIDPERDYRILRLERYNSLEEPLRWKELTRRIDNIKLQKINDTWIPIEGEYYNYKPQEVPISGYTEEDIKKMKPEEAVYKIDYTLEPLVPMRLIKIEPESVSFGKELPEDKFRIQWPEGTTIWDDFLQTGYVIGGSMTASKQLDTMVQENESISIGNMDNDSINQMEDKNIKNDKKDLMKPESVLSQEKNSVMSFSNQGAIFLLLPLIAVSCIGIIILISKHKKRFK